MNAFIGSNRHLVFVMACIVVLSFAPEIPAAEINDLIFIHHSCGENWLNSGLHDALLAKQYVDERNDITYGTVLPPDPGRPASLGDVPGDNTNMAHWILWFNDYLGQVKQHDCGNGTNRIVLFKSCFPTSDIWDDGTEPGDPFPEDQTLANYRAVYRHPDGPGRKYTHEEREYLPLEDIFARHPEILFIPVTAPPLVYNGTDDANAHRARLFNNWLKNDWLASYNKAHPALKNVAVFDWFNLLANADNAASGPNRLKAAYGGLGDDSHPNDSANAASITAFATGMNNFIDAAWAAYSSATTVGTAGGNRGPASFRLEQNHPNPFNSETRLRFNLPGASPVRLSVFDLQGRERAVIVNTTMAAGSHEAGWNGLDENRQSVPSGVYLAVLKTPACKETRRLLLLK